MGKVAAVLILGVLGIAAVVGFFFFTKPKKPSSNTNQSPTVNSAKGEYKFQDPKKSAHFETSTPNHGEVLAGVPINVVVDFNFDLADNSTISITKDGEEYGTGSTKVDPNNLAMRRVMELSSPDGLYLVKYNACWPDKSCHDGSFQFAIDRSKSESFTDMTNKSEVLVELSQTKFIPENLSISKGTKVTWINNDNFVHYINTDPHPSHTYFLDQNSKALSKGDTYTVTFQRPGIYPYHCSAHAATMRAMILVR
jgi:plastocyanin